MRSFQWTGDRLFLRHRGKMLPGTRYIAATYELAPQTCKVSRILL